MREVDKRTQLRRRSFLRGGAAAAPAAALAAAGATISPEAAWASDARNLQPNTLATLVKAARDIFPHDRFSDRHYITAIVPYDERAGTDGALRSLMEDGVGALDNESRRRFGKPYLAVGMEDQRVEVLKTLEATPFFKKLRGDLVVSLYNQKEVWPKLGYEGSSFEHGGYLERGFNDIDWLPEA
jgi:hypothetical protein